jgi:hypothetical protein
LRARSSDNAKTASRENLAPAAVVAVAVIVAALSSPFSLYLSIPDI